MTSISGISIWMQPIYMLLVIAIVFTILLLILLENKKASKFLKKLDNFIFSDIKEWGAKQ